MSQFQSSVAAKLTIATLSVSLICMPVRAGIDSDLNSFFNSMGAQSNVTAPGAFKGQTQNVISGGGLYMRTPQRNYSLANITMPSARAGCGGIDLFAGSFSFINKSQYVAMVRNIGNNAVGYAFQLAIDAIDPMIGTNLKELAQKLQDMNSRNISSCENANALVKGIKGAVEESNRMICGTMGADLGTVSDAFEAREKCVDPSIMDTVRAGVNADPAKKELAGISFTGGNLMAQVIEKSFGYLSDEEKRFLISLTGTYVYDPSTYESNFYQPTIKDEKDIIAGLVGGTTGKVKLDLLDCVSPDSVTCGQSQIEIISLRQKVLDRLDDYSATLSSGNANWSVTKKLEMMDFVNVSSIPILRVMELDLTTNAGLRNTYADYIAGQYIVYYLDTMIRKASEALGKTQSRDAAEEQGVKSMVANLTELKRILIANEGVMSNKVAAATDIQIKLAAFEQTMATRHAQLASNVALTKVLNAQKPQ